MSGFDVARHFAGRFGGHGGRLGLAFHAIADEWVEIVLPFSPDLVGDEERGVLASGPIVALMDVATSLAVWQRNGRFVPHATLDLRVDYLRPAVIGRKVIGRGECYRITRSIAFARGVAYDDAPDDPIAHVAGTFMAPDGYR